MIIAELSAGELARRIQQGSLLVPVGPLVVRVEANDPTFLSTLQLLYGTSVVFPTGSLVADLVLQLRRHNRRESEWFVDGMHSDRVFVGDVAFAHFEWAMHLAMAQALAPSTTVHAAVAARADGRAVALVGRSGSGKSTLLAGLVTRGWRLVADEFLVLRPDGGIDPVPSVIALKGPSISLIDEWRHGAGILGPVGVDRDRGPVAHLAAPEVILNGEGLRIAAIGFPYFRAAEEPKIVPFARGEAILRLAQQSHNYHLTGPTGFRQLASLAKAPAFAMRYRSMAEGFAAVEEIMGEA